MSVQLCVCEMCVSLAHYNGRLSRFKVQGVPPPPPPPQDLKSSNMLEVSMALIIICKLMGAEMIPPLLPLVQDKLLHPK